MPKENKTELIGLRFTERERQTIENFISEYNGLNNTDLNLTEFCRTAIFSHMYALQNNDFIIEDTTIENIETQIGFLSTLNTFFQNTQKELTKMITSLNKNRSLFKGNGQMIKQIHLISPKQQSTKKKKRGEEN